MYNRKKIIFPSIIAMCVACPVLAIDIDTLGKIDGENAMCNVNSALENDTGARFIARWTPNTYTCNPGTFLDHLTATCVTCTANYICPGGTHTFSESSDIGITSCESAAGNKYPYSDAGNSDSDMCYMSGTDSCSKINPVDNGRPTYATSGSSIPFRRYALNEGYYATNTIGACAITALTCDTGYTLNPTTNGPLANYIGQGSKISKANTKWRALDGSTDGSSKTSDGFGNSTGMTNGTVAYAWNNGTKIHFRASCNSTPAGSEFPYSTFNSSSTGVNCWCNMDSYTISGSTTSVTDTKWVFASKFDNSSNCASQCTSACYSKFHTKTEFEQTLFGTYGQQMACELDYINCAPGYYLPANATQCVICTMGNYCEGGSFLMNSYDQGINVCSTDGTYPYSAAGATSRYECYTNATTTCAAKNPYYFGHGTANYATSGSINCKSYAGMESGHGNGVNNICTLDSISTCNITSLSCDTGYTQTGTNGVLANYINENTPNSSPFVRYRNIDDSSNHGDQTGLSVGDWEVKWLDGTTVRGTGSCNTDGAVPAYINDNDEALISGTMTPQAFITGFAAIGTQEQTARITEILTQYSNGTMPLSEVYIRSIKEFFVNPTANYNTSSSGQYCWCKMTNYSLQGGTSQSTPSSNWVFLYNEGSSANCASHCANICANNMRYNVIRNAIFGSLGANMECTVASYTCEPGTYLPANATQCVACTTGNYCLGGTFNYSANAQGLTACPNTHPNSAAGAASQNMCYVQQTRECATANPYNGGHGTATYNN
ncbi:MAG: hypothetical protein J6W08_01330, partial [Alphaproteobacteria bacterium]|nr:hypothetical protein [Alphaproteobacteria bacterium]